MSKKKRKVWEYMGDLIPALPGVPAEDLTDDEHAYYCELVGEAAMRGVWVRAGESAKAPGDPEVAETAKADEAAEAAEGEES